MEFQSNGNPTDENQPGPFLTVLNNVLGIGRWLTWFFTLTEEERVLAGVYVPGDEDHR